MDKDEFILSLLNELRITKKQLADAQKEIKRLNSSKQTDIEHKLSQMTPYEQWKYAESWAGGFS